jgi:RNA polymerase sigma-70 factor (ECF subfamily)
MSAETLTNTLDFGVAKAITKDDMSGFDSLYQQHYRRVFSICLRMTGNMSEAEDLAQDVFLQLYRKIKSFRGESAFTTWLHRLTVNQVLMHFRKRSVRSELTTEDGEMPESAEIGTDQPTAMPIIDRIALEAAIAELPPGYRSVFVLHDVQGYEHEEIAKILKCNVGTSKSQLHKARMKLRRLIQQRQEPQAA